MRAVKVLIWQSTSGRRSLLQSGVPARKEGSGIRRTAYMADGQHLLSPKGSWACITHGGRITIQARLDEQLETATTLVTLHSFIHIQSTRSPTIISQHYSPSSGSPISHKLLHQASSLINGSTLCIFSSWTTNRYSPHTHWTRFLRQMTGLQTSPVQESKLLLSLMVVEPQVPSERGRPTLPNHKQHHFLSINIPSDEFPSVQTINSTKQSKQARLIAEG